MLPTSSERVRSSRKSPNSRCPTAAEATSGTAWTRSVPTSSEERSIGYRSNNSTIISDPEPTEVMPTTSPPTTPLSTVGRGRKRNGSPGPGRTRRGRAPAGPSGPGAGPWRRSKRQPPATPPENLLDAGLNHRPVAQRPQHQHAGEGGRHRPDHQPADQPEVDGAAMQMDPATDGLHDHRGHQVAGNGGQRLDVERQHQDRGHQRAAAHPGQAHGEPDEQPGGGHIQVDLQGRTLHLDVGPYQLDRDTRETRASRNPASTVPAMCSTG
jgi:hypothetical protein